jgi:murein DD-endopeptidase MepM/ murein hydrolase activator NlpD
MRGLLPTRHCPLRRAANACSVTVTVAVGLVVAVVCASPTPAEATAPSEGQGAAYHGAEAAGLAQAKIRRFWVRDKHFYFSKWYAGKHRKMINFGCTKAPYYDPSPRCPHQEGFHHGVDIAMPCETKLFAGVRGTIVRPDAPGSLGSAYGPYAFRIRNHRLHLDFVIGHVLHVYVRPGDHVAKGTLMARASDQGAPDGCHLHFEVRPQATSFDSAINPMRYLDLRRHRVR